METNAIAIARYAAQYSYFVRRYGNSRLGRRLARHDARKAVWA